MKEKLKLLLLISSLSIFAAEFLTPIYAIFVENIGGDILTAGSTYAIYSIIAGIVMFFLAKWEDRFKHQEKFIAAGYFLSFLGFAGYLFVSEPWHLFLVQGLFGISIAIRAPAYDGTYSRNMDKGKFASEWGTWEAMAWLVAGIAALTGSYIAENFGFRIVFFVMAAFALSSFLFSLKLLRK